MKTKIPGEGSWGMIIPTGPAKNPDGSLKLADPNLKIPTFNNANKSKGSIDHTDKISGEDSKDKIEGVD